MEPDKKMESLQQTPEENMPLNDAEYQLLYSQSVETHNTQQDNQPLHYGYYYGNPQYQYPDNSNQQFINSHQYPLLQAPHSFQYNQQTPHQHHHRHHKNHQHSHQFPGPRGGHRGRGCRRQFAEKEGGHNYYKKNFKNKKKNYSSSSSNEQYVQEWQKLSQQMDGLSLQTTDQQKIFEALSVILSPFNLKEKPEHKIKNFVLKNINKIQEMQPFLNMFYILQEEHPEFFNKLSLVKICKVIIKRDYNMEQICQKLEKQLMIKQKKYEKDQEFHQKFDHIEEIKFLQKEQLLELNSDTTLFLIDFDNIVTKEKIFRWHYENRKVQEKAEAQVRVSWLIAEAIPNAEVFMDYRYSDNIIDRVKKEILSPEQKQIVDKLPIHYAQKDKDITETADQRLIQRLKQIKGRGEYQGINKIVVVSADRELIQLCRQISMIEQTSGQFIFKFCKQAIKKKYYTKPEMKGIIKRIFS